MASHPNGVAVGDLLVLIEPVERRGLRALLLAGLFESHEGNDARVVVRRGRTVVADRTFRNWRTARRVRDGFVAAAERLAAVPNRGQEWQEILDRL